MIDTIGNTDTNSDWLRFEGAHIPSSLELDLAVFEYLQKSSKILDIGCGFGKTIFELNKLGYKNIVGVDINPSGISYAKSESARRNSDSRFEVGDAKNLDFENQTFDFVIAQAFWTTIVKSEDRLKIAKEINRVLKTDGKIYIADFGRTWSLSHYRKAYENGVKDNLELGTFKVYNKQTGEFMYLAHHYTRYELSELLKESGFCKPLCYKSTVFTTQSGNRVKGHVLVANKQSNDKAK